MRCRRGEGCTDASACNYDADPTTDTDDVDGIRETCEGGLIVDNDQDDDGVCDDDEVTGCTDATACNYDATPTTDTNNALCVYLTDGETCSGETDGTGTVIDNDADDDGVCDADELEGCTDASACNYDATPTTDTDNALCVYLMGCETCPARTNGTGTGSTTMPMTMVFVTQTNWRLYRRQRVQLRRRPHHRHRQYAALTWMAFVRRVRVD